MIAMQTMIHHTTIVTADDTCAVHYDAAIVIEADRIERAAWQRLYAERPALTPPSGFHPLLQERQTASS
jgi:hypothetical protein